MATKIVKCSGCGKDVEVSKFAKHGLCKDCKKNGAHLKITINCKNCGTELIIPRKKLKTHQQLCERCIMDINKTKIKIVKCSTCNKKIEVPLYTSVARCPECIEQKKVVGTRTGKCDICGKEMEIGKYAAHSVCDLCKSRWLSIEGDKKEYKCYNCNNTFQVGIELNRPRLCEKCLSEGVEIKTKITNCYTCNKEIEVALYSNRYVRCDECVKNFIKSDLSMKIVQCDHCKQDIEVSNLLHTKILCKDCKRSGITIDSHMEAARKRKQYWLENYGVENPSQIKEIIKKKFSIIKENYIKFYLNTTLKALKLKILEEYIDSNTVYTFECLECGTQFKAAWFNVQQYKRCPKCNPSMAGTSKAEIEILEFLKTLTFNENDEIITKCRNVIKNPNTDYNLELDFYLPNYNLAIEFNGLYWHNDEYKSETYHLVKYNLCKEKNIRLIQIFEDEWLFKQDIVKSRLKHILNKSTAQRIYGRNCEIKEIDSKTKNEFLSLYHIQGKDTASIKLGAFYNNELVAVMTFSKERFEKNSDKHDVYELSRFCINNNYIVVGCASKLLSYFTKNYKWKRLVTFADLRWSDGNLYERIGFSFKRQTKPGYFYVKGLKRIHRLNLRKSKDNPDGLPESVLRISQGYTKVYDCGNLKFEMINEDY